MTIGQRIGVIAERKSGTKWKTGGALDAGVKESLVFDRIVVEPVETTVLSKMAPKKSKIYGAGKLKSN